MKQFLCGILALACLAGLTACGGKEETPASAANEGTAQEQSHIYTTQVQYTGEDDPVQYLEIAARSAHLLAELEDKAGAFVADFYNYQAMDDASTPLYTMNGMQFAEEIDPKVDCKPRFPFCYRVSHFESEVQNLYPKFHFCSNFPVSSCHFVL